jgi:hypothetical protein
MVFQLTIAGSECSVEFVSFLDSDEVVGNLEVQLIKDSEFAHSIM